MYMTFPQESDFISKYWLLPLMECECWCLIMRPEYTLFSHTDIWAWISQTATILSSSIVFSPCLYFISHSNSPVCELVGSFVWQACSLSQSWFSKCSQAQSCTSFLCLVDLQRTCHQTRSTWARWRVRANWRTWSWMRRSSRACWICPPGWPSTVCAAIRLPSGWGTLANVGFCKYAQRFTKSTYRLASCFPLFTVFMQR